NLQSRPRVSTLDALGKIFEKLGICREADVIKCFMYGISPLMTTNLFIKDLKFGKVSVRVYQPKTPSAGPRRGVVYLHGGVGLFGSIKYLKEKMASPIDTMILNHSEEYGVDPTRIIICGDSSGGTLTAAVCQTLVNRRDLPKVRAQIMFYPFLQGLDFNLPSYQQNGSVPFLLKERSVTLGMQYLNKDVSLVKDVLDGCHVPEDLKQKFRKWLSPDNIPMEFKIRGYKPHASASYSEELHILAKPAFETIFSPLLAEDAIISEDAIICQLPETFILTCEYDVVRDDGLLYKKRLEDNGVPVTWYHIEDGFHGVLFLTDTGYFSFPCGRRAMKIVLNFIKGL
uniref:Alpha/beta hydrolase fold-3 domain-containing protein n=1 Tax=Pelusios castaneus TaxID=367368 RepID=A0A8C8S7H0_9SAUR